MRNPIYLNHSYLTRDGHKARVLTTTMRNADYPVVALITFDTGEEPVVLTKTGCFDVDQLSHPYDLEKDITE